MQRHQHRVILSEAKDLGSRVALLIEFLRVAQDDRRLEDSQYLIICPKCGCRDLFIRKDFPQKLGLAIVVLAAVAFLVLAAWRSSFYLGAIVLIAATIIDAILYVIVPKITVCYRCRAEFRDVPINPKHEGFELAIGEKYRTP